MRYHQTRKERLDLARLPNNNKKNNKFIIGYYKITLRRINNADDAACKGTPKILAL